MFLRTLAVALFMILAASPPVLATGPQCWDAAGEATCVWIEEREYPACVGGDDGTSIACNNYEGIYAAIFSFLFGQFLYAGGEAGETTYWRDVDGEGCASREEGEGHYASASATTVLQGSLLGDAFRHVTEGWAYAGTKGGTRDDCNGGQVQRTEAYAGAHGYQGLTGGVPLYAEAALERGSDCQVEARTWLPVAGAVQHEAGAERCGL